MFISPKMLSLIIRMTLLVLVLNHFITPCMGLRGSGGKGMMSGGKYQAPIKGVKEESKTTGLSAGVPGVSPTRRGLGMSAWGLILLIVSLILGGMGFYYFSMCYPILCKKERNYDIIQLEKV